MAKNGALKPNQMRQSQGAKPSGNAAAVSKLNQYTTPRGAVTGRTSAGTPVPKSVIGRSTSGTGSC